MRIMTADEVRTALAGEAEIALLDVREHGQYGEGHPLLAVNLPYSRIEIAAPALLPRKSVPIVLLDDGDGVADKAARRLTGLGYTDIAILKGGAPAWHEAGHVLFKGVNVPSKVLGELVELARHTPSVNAEELKAWQDRGDAFVLLDGRPDAEHRRMSVPGSIGCPSTELGYRFGAMVPDSTVPVVVHCAGRTRSIIGAESLRELGVENPVYALKDGTQGWQLAGFELEHGSERFAPPIDARERAFTGDAGRRLRERHGIPTVDQRRVGAWQADADRTLYLLDVRTQEEFLAGRFPGTRHAPGGQLVQATDQWIAVRNARIVLADDTGLRASMTAFWLRQMGHDVHVLACDSSRLVHKETGAPPEPAIAETLPLMPLSELKQAMAKGAVLLDFNPSAAYRKGHIGSARWRIRPRLDRLGLGRASVILLAEDRRMAELAAMDLRELDVTDLHYAPGGPDEWRAAGLEVVATPDDPSDRASVDYLFFVHDRHQGNLDAMRGYLAWETGLVDQLDERDRAVFRLVP